jgi:hypothetical protein
MTSKTIKVDRVASADEAIALETAGADIIGVDLDRDLRFADDRTLALASIAEIRESLRQAHLAVAMNLHADPADVVRLATRTGADMVQPIMIAIPPSPVRAALRDAGLGIVYAGVDISHDEDPSWIFGAHDDEPNLNATLFQADVLPEYRNSWAFLRDSSPEYPEEFQIADLDELARGRPLLANLDTTPDNILEILERLPSIHGLALVLGEHPTRGDVRHHSFPAAIALLNAVRLP